MPKHARHSAVALETEPRVPVQPTLSMLSCSAAVIGGTQRLPIAWGTSAAPQAAASSVPTEATLQLEEPGSDVVVRFASPSMVSIQTPNRLLIDDLRIE